VGPDDLAYLAFTSGSTGRPKGVRGRHGPLSHFLPWQARALAVGPGDRFSLLSGLAHDPLQRDVFTALALGATLCVPAGEMMDVPGRLAEWMGAEGITTAHLTPAMGRVLAEGAAAELGALRWALFVGEVLAPADVARLRGLAPGVTCINLYGSTETQRAVGWLRVDPGKAVAGHGLPIGEELPDVQILVLDAEGRLAGLGEPGEICVRSPHLAAGYLDDPELTRERFVANPFRDGAEAGDRLYRTGDLGRRLRNGTVEFLGRRDQQVKIRGFRIELGEIESALAGHAAVEEAVALLREDRPGDRRLAAYVVARRDGAPSPSPESLRAHVAARLPGYMVPSAYVVLERMPLTPNRKVDRRALPVPDEEALGGAEFEAPASPMEQALAALWSEVLGVERVGRGDGFFALGGHSLLATRVVARVRESLGVELPVRTLFEAPVLADLAARIEALGAAPVASGLAAAPEAPAGSAERAAPATAGAGKRLLHAALGGAPQRAPRCAPPGAGPRRGDRPPRGVADGSRGGRRAAGAAGRGVGASAPGAGVAGRPAGGAS
jgi:amino acid adenylation domain-containing protein